MVVPQGSQPFPVPVCPGLGQMLLFFGAQQAHGFNCRWRRDGQFGVDGWLILRTQPRCNPVLVARKASSSKRSDGMGDIGHECPSPSAPVPPCGRYTVKGHMAQAVYGGDQVLIAGSKNGKASRMIHSQGHGLPSPESPAHGPYPRFFFSGQPVR